MTNWINPLDKVPQIPQDYANHFIYAQLMFVALVLAMNSWWALAVAIVVSIGKKVVDYRREMEPVGMCVMKAATSIAGAVVPFVCLLR